MEVRGPRAAVKPRAASRFRKARSFIRMQHYFALNNHVALRDRALEAYHAPKSDAAGERRAKAREELGKAPEAPRGPLQQPNGAALLRARILRFSNGQPRYILTRSAANAWKASGMSLSV